MENGILHHIRNSSVNSRLPVLLLKNSLTNGTPSVWAWGLLHYLPTKLQCHHSADHNLNTLALENKKKIKVYFQQSLKGMSPMLTGNYDRRTILRGTK
jgi:hypothetical protein